MTYRDPVPELPACPVCDRVDEVQRHTNPNQGPYICMRDMLIFSGTSAEWVTPPDRPKATDEIAAARAALRGGRT